MASAPHKPPRAVYLNKIPGYREALARARRSEFRTREDNWLALPATIACRNVRVITVRDYVALLRLRSPFLNRTEPTFEDLGTFLWVLSPEIDRWHNRQGWRKAWLVDSRWSLFSIEQWQVFLAARRLRKAVQMSQVETQAREWNAANPGKTYELPEDCELSQAFKAAFEYVERLFIDRPAGIAKDGPGSGLLYLTSWFDAMQSEYHFDDETVWRMPLPHLFGRLRAIQHRMSPGEPDFNARQDALAATIQKALQNKTTTIEDLQAGRFEFKDN